MKIPRILQLIGAPFSLMYQLILRLRNFMFNIGLLKETQFDIPTISVGNLAFGGTGKTPHIEFLISLLESQFKTAVLSRGYKRKTKGYVFAGSDYNAQTIGDEPMQLKQKFPATAVAVCEDRVLGLPQLLQDAPETAVVLLDDCFQHRYLKPGLNLLLTDYNKLYTDDFLFPMGTLREYAAAAERAHVIVVSKCPTNMSHEAQLDCKKKLKPLPHQSVYFSCINYSNPYLYNSQPISAKDKVLFFAGIANIDPAIQYLKSIYKTVECIHFNDHQSYQKSILDQISTQLSKLGNDWQLLTTEKDFAKLNIPENNSFLSTNQLGVLPISIEIIGTENQFKFKQHILDYVKQVQ